jgi:choline dehydrogenase
LECDLEFGREAWHGDAGPIPVTRYQDIELSPFESAVAEACVAAGLALIDDHNRPGALGAGRMPRNARNGVRVTSVDGYLPADGSLPPRLEIWPDSQVASILIQDDQAVGLRLVDGTEVEAGWVVLCAGTYGSPAILLRSGIGPPEHLRDLGIEVKVALPGVGANLADHQGFDVDVGFQGAARGPRFFWLATFRGAAATENEPPDLALWIPEPFSVGEQAAGADVTAVLLTPRSRGSLRLRSADPVAPPVIRLPGLTHPADLDRLVEAALLAKDVADHPALRHICHERSRGLPKQGGQLRAVVAQEAWSYPHTVGTCAMGPSPNAGAVVDASGQVHGVARLNVADASIIPTAPSGFPHVIALMIAERTSELLASRV